jgi:methylated-DNA-protein-cysteine methyltransferase-like protein
MMGRVLLGPSAKAELLALVRNIARGRVTTVEILADETGVPPPVIVVLLQQLSEDERDMVPWHRVVAKGGAIGRGPHRDQQFACLVREGVAVSPAGIVQDMPRFVTKSFDPPDGVRGSESIVAPETPKYRGRSRGMKLRP